MEGLVALVSIGWPYRTAGGKLKQREPVSWLSPTMARWGRNVEG